MSSRESRELSFSFAPVRVIRGQLPARKIIKFSNGGCRLTHRHSSHSTIDVGLCSIQLIPIMRRQLLIAAVLLVFTSGVRAAQAPDPVLVDSLRTFEAHGIEA